MHPPGIGEYHDGIMQLLAVEGKTLWRCPLSIDDRVEDQGECWEPKPVTKMHYQVTLEDGQELAVFRNMKTGSWYRAEAR